MTFTAAFLVGICLAAAPIASAMTMSSWDGTGCSGGELVWSGTASGKPGDCMPIEGIQTYPLQNRKSIFLKDRTRRCQIHPAHLVRQRRLHRSAPLPKPSFLAFRNQHGADANFLCPSLILHGPQLQQARQSGASQPMRAVQERPQDQLVLVGLQELGTATAYCPHAEDEKALPQRSATISFGFFLQAGLQS
jgi:hypothetical protein